MSRLGFVVTFNQCSTVVPATTGTVLAPVRPSFQMRSFFPLLRA
jgi:hypothetical protein